MKMMTILCLIFVLTLAISPVIALEAKPTEFLSAGEYQWLKQNESKIVLEYDALCAPVEYDEKGVHKGIAADVATLIESQLNITFQRRASFDWPQTLKNLESGKVHLNPATASTPEREKYAFFTDPYISIPIVFIGLLTSPKISMDKIKGEKIAVVNEYYSESVLRSHSDTSTFTIVEVSTVSEGLAKVSLGEVDYFFDNLAYCAWYLGKESLGGLKVAGETPFTWELAFVVSKKYPELYAIIGKTLKSIPPEKLREVKQKWTGAKTDYSVLIWGVGSALAIISVVLLILFQRDRYRNYLTRKELEASQKKLAQKLTEISAQLPGAMVYQVVIHTDGSRVFTKVLQKFTVFLWNLY